MCNSNNLQQIIQQRTGGGKIIADFLFDTVQGKTPGVKAYHQMEAARHLIRLGNPDDHTATLERHSRANGNPAGQDTGGINTPSPSTGEEPASAKALTCMN